MWVRSDDAKPLNRKVRPLSDGAYRLDDHALHYCARHETDGLIHQSDLEEITLGLKTKRIGPLITELTDAELWHPPFSKCLSQDCPAGRGDVPAGTWAKHDYFEYNKTHAELESIRMTDRKRKRNPSGIPLESERTPNTPSRPVPSRPVRGETPSVGSPRLEIESRGYRGTDLESTGEILRRAVIRQ